MNDIALWICTPNYFDEVKDSYASLVRWMPQLRFHVMLVNGNTDQLGTIPPYMDIIPCQIDIEPWYLKQTLVFRDYFATLCQDRTARRLLWLDTDTYIVQPIDELYELLDTFNLVGTHAPGRSTGHTVHPVPDSFPELNIGMTGWQVSEETDRFVQWWAEQYIRHKDIYLNNDQGPLREALWIYCSQVLNFRFYVFPPEYNCRWYFGGFAQGPVKVLHGRAKDIAKVAQDINQNQRMRGWKAGDF